jgi:hypothetical protein
MMGLKWSLHISPRVIMLIMFLASFSIRCLMFFTDVYVRLRWYAYDTDFYIDNGVKCVEEILRGNFTVLNMFTGHPPLGFITIGLSVKLTQGFLTKYHAVTLLMCITSSLTCILIYYIGLSVSRKVAFIACILASFDPFYIRWTIVWLDMQMLLFLLLFSAIYLKEGERRFYMVLSGVAGGLSVLFKYMAAPIIALIVLFFKRGWRSRFTVLIIAVATAIMLSPALQSVDVLSRILAGHFKANVLGEEDFIAAENVVLAWYPGKFWFRLDTFIWTFLYYFGLSQNGPNQPFITPFIAYIALIYKLARREGISFNFYWVWLSVSLITLAFFTKHWPYYDVILTPPITLLTASLLNSIHSQKPVGKEVDGGKVMKLLRIPALIYISLTPISLISSLTFPTLWLFILTLLNNKELFPAEYYSSLALTISLLIYSITITALSIKNN